MISIFQLLTGALKGAVSGSGREAFEVVLSYTEAAPSHNSGTFVCLVWWFFYGVYHAKSPWKKTHTFFLHICFMFYVVQAPAFFANKSKAQHVFFMYLFEVTYLSLLSLMMGVGASQCGELDLWDFLSDRIWGGYSDLPPPPRMLARHHQNDSEFLVGELHPRKKFISHWHLGWGGRENIFMAQKETHLKTNMATLPETNSSHCTCQEACPQKEIIVFQPSDFQVRTRSFREGKWKIT